MTASLRPQKHEDRPRNKMLLSSRANPPKPLNVAEPARYLSIRHLLPQTPIPSPSLPSILPRHGKKPPKLNSRKIVRSILWLSFLIGVYYLIAFGKTRTRNLADWTFLSSSGKTYEIIEAAEIPDHPTPLAVTDTNGKHHWTISIPPKLGFPLPSTEYADICSQVDEVARHVAGRRLEHSRQDYYQHDPNFIDIDNAQSRGFLPRNVDSPTAGDALPICTMSLTYVLDATDAGLGAALLGMWLSYSLAKREHRSFFIDDTNFPYGNYDTFFTSRPAPPCRSPPATHRVPCPHQADHLVVSAATASWSFGDAFHQHYTHREIFDMAREGYEALFKLAVDDDEYVRNRAAKLRVPDDDDEPAPGLVGIHIRRGDCHPYEYAYRQSYLPPGMYMAAARKLVGQSERWKVILASDDADMYDNIELSDTVRAQQRISLASKKQLDDGLGWEGGFFKDVFWALGLPLHVHELKRIGSPAPAKSKADSQPLERVATEEDDRDYRTHPSKEALQLRELLARAYLLDLAMLAQSDKVICGVSSNACRILAVMLGWDRAFQNGDWTSVDGSYAWRAIDY